MSNFLTVFFTFLLLQLQVLIPVQVKNRKSCSEIRLTKIGQFGLMRKARPNVPGHYHTGIDIMRPGKNYISEPIFPVAEGTVVSKRTVGPYANLIIEHKISGSKVWSLYEHIAGIKVNVNDAVRSDTPIARFMNKKELDAYGWQFDHFHFELLKVEPRKLKPSKANPERFYNSYTLTCYTSTDLKKYYFNPIEYFSSHLKN